MNCPEAIREIPFYCYGELSGEIEEKLEAHLAACEDCTAEWKLHRTFLETLDSRETDAETISIGQCRASLHRALESESALQRGRPVWNPGGWLEALRNLSQFHIPLRVPVGALALVALGWFGARYAPEKFGGIRAGLGSEPMFSSVRSVEPDGSGRIQISVDDVSRRVVSGTAGDPRIQGLLLSAVREESNPGIRVESIGILKDRAGSEEVRQALLDTVSHDPNAGVRLKALEGLKAYAGDAAVRKTLASVLLKDDNPGVRVQAIDLLTSRRDDALVGVLQQIIEKEDNTYVKTRCRNMLQEMKASVGTY